MGLMSEKEFYVLLTVGLVVPIHSVSKDPNGPKLSVDPIILNV